MSRYGLLITLAIVLTKTDALAQTRCGMRHRGTGVFICYPNPADDAAEASVPNLFHFSAQANAPEGVLIRQYSVFIDGRPIYSSKLSAPLKRMSIEINLKSPFETGSHTLRFEVQRTGTAQVDGLRFHSSKDPGICDPFSRSDPRVCNTGTAPGTLHWSMMDSEAIVANGQKVINPDQLLDAYEDYVQNYSLNLKSIEADASDAVTNDTRGNLYVASHSFADLEVRKYSPGGGIAYDSLVRSCGPGIVSVASIVASDSGVVWIAGNTSACYPSTPNAFVKYSGRSERTRGFVLMIDTRKPSAAPPAYFTYLSEMECRIAALRVDGAGNAYVVGETTSADYPHSTLLTIDHDGSAISGNGSLGFISVLNSSGSEMLWSSLVDRAKLNALSIGKQGDVYLTGHITTSAANPCTHCVGDRKLEGRQERVVIFTLSDRGRKLSYMAQLGGWGNGDGKAVSTAAKDDWVFVAGVTDSLLTTPTMISSVSGGPRSFIAALSTCANGPVYARVLSKAASNITPAIAFSPTLDALASIWSTAFASGLPQTMAQRLIVRKQVAPPCTASRMEGN